ncbi:SGNH/GDSL hydrolase family protein [Verrucosispora sp. WMMA2044]|uniref:SGNH/GDSL hydrolase family protein n=1 Tax=Verrucosispora sioxanthis TaxID=2499994 RepID=A0A6M1LAQ2_9ACTN|nr:MULTISPECIES: SGNH/GDSL hydrolase family protein [Micromonospora]NEE66147.1 SGNH/GDSL hydrolase family protein [Verrucosispora sioxanthis]NGM15257.1 SGNH/GDSL hydrolase family protein [Verrucosispora sioxanthis]WBB50355.1 SGNH/GDSL hydrolase family protein [Verrucosispora sp. WMMA2044]
MTSRGAVSPGRQRRLLAMVAVIGGLLVSAQPALAATPPVDDGAAALPAARGAGWQPDIQAPDPVTLPGTTKKVTPFATPLTPQQPKALPGASKGPGATLKADSSARAAIRTVDMPTFRGTSPQADPDDPPTGLYCTEAITRNSSVSGTPNQTNYAANISYLAEFGCNFWLNAAYIATGVIDRGRFDGQFLYTTAPLTYGQTYYGATSGGVSIPGELFDGGRTVEIAFELYLLAPAGVYWGGCFPIPGLRYLLCEGLGTNLLHIVLGTGPFGTGLQSPVIRHVALGDSYSSGTGAPPYSDASCRRSPATYANLITGTVLSGLPVDRPTLAACHGARIPDLYASQQSGLPPQLDAIQPHTRLVTLTIGGNDLGFSAKLTGCYLGADCSASGPLVTPQELYQVQAQLTTLYRQIRAEMHPGGKLMVLSYPAVVPNPDDPADPQPTQDRCPDLGSNLVESERRAIYEATVQTDRMIRDAVLATGDSRVVYVNGLDLFRGHRLCSTNGVWANGLTSPLSDSFHPNASGYQAMATRVAQVLPPL